jgi:alkylhydroperoxidase family enzyme
MTLDANHIGDDQFESLREHFDEGEIVELMASIGLFNYFNRFNNALQMEPTKPGDGAE